MRPQTTHWARQSAARTHMTSVLCIVLIYAINGHQPRYKRRERYLGRDPPPRMKGEEGRIYIRVRCTIGVGRAEWSIRVGTLGQFRQEKKKELRSHARRRERSFIWTDRDEYVYAGRQPSAFRAQPFLLLCGASAIQSDVNDTFVAGEMTTGKTAPKRWFCRCAARGVRRSQYKTTRNSSIP